MKSELVGLNQRTLYTEYKYGGPLGRPGTTSVKARLVSPQRGFSPFVLIGTHIETNKEEF